VAKVFTMSAFPDPNRRKGQPRNFDPRYIEGQRLLVEAMKYLAQQDPDKNKEAVCLNIFAPVSECPTARRTRARQVPISDKPGSN
jgi:hypothetical protein